MREDQNLRPALVVLESVDVHAVLHVNILFVTFKFKKRQGYSQVLLSRFQQ